MSTIQVSRADFEMSSESEALADVNAVMNQTVAVRYRREIKPETARAIAAWWQSPGSVGRVLAAFAGGQKVDRTELLDDIHCTRPEARTEIDREALDCLSTFVIHYGRE